MEISIEILIGAMISFSITMIIGMALIIIGRKEEAKKRDMTAEQRKKLRKEKNKKNKKKNKR